MAGKPRRPLTVIGKEEIVLDNQTVTYLLKRSARARCARLEIRQATGLTVVIPKSYSVTQLDDLIQKKKRWVLNNLNKYCQPPVTAADKELKSGDCILYLGRELKVIVQRTYEDDDCVTLKNNKLIISLGSENSGVDVALERWYRLQAVRLIKEKADELSSRFGLAFNRLTIRGQRSRWGSCSRKGNLSFNWRLMMAPEPVIDYVITHELMHLKEMNHNKRFWVLVSEHCPQWRKHRKWLKEHEAELTTRLST